MRTLVFAKRNLKEITRDFLSVIFAILLPLFLLFIFQQFKIPNEVYDIENFVPGILLFGFSFISMFTAMLVASDREKSFLVRLHVSPMRSYEYIMGYVLALVPIVIIQNVLFFMASLLLGLSFSLNIIYVILVSLVMSILFIMIGLLLGAVTSVKGASGVGSIVVQLVAFTSGMYFSVDMVGSVFAFICEVLPFSACLNILRSVLARNLVNWSEVILVFVYVLIVSIVSIKVFRKNMVKD